jgi:hypothetical protein
LRERCKRPWGNAKDAEKKAVDKLTDTTNQSADDSTETDEIDVRGRRKVS